MERGTRSEMSESMATALWQREKRKGSKRFISMINPDWQAKRQSSRLINVSAPAYIHNKAQLFVFGDTFSFSSECGEKKKNPFHSCRCRDRITREWITEKAKGVQKWREGERGNDSYVHVKDIDDSRLSYLAIIKKLAHALWTFALRYFFFFALLKLNRKRFLRPSVKCIIPPQLDSNRGHT